MHRKASANGKADFLSRLLEPPTAHDRSGSASLNSSEDGSICLIRACGFRTRSIPEVGLGGVVPCPNSAVVSGLPLFPLPISAIFAPTVHV